MSKTLEAQKRKIFGRKLKRLRREGILPANIYGRGVESLAIQVNLQSFQKLLSKVGETEIVELNVEGEKKARPVLIHGTQSDPVTDQLLHADFHQVDLTEKVIVAVPIVFVGKSPAVEVGNMLLELMNEVEVEALPTKLPSKIEIDISELKEVGDGIVVADLKLPKEVKVQAQGEDLICKVEAPSIKEEKEEKPAEEAGVEVEAEVKEEKAEEDEVRPRSADRS